ncbi:MAG: nickel pincer cofactor biosynthesis protein LarC [Planctomycetes bacterium]|nr:nickel pincer cofactor biosynthesis protein LarC [Planctomycetota bacterium]
MKIAYLDCSSGISGDMTLGALVDAGVPLEPIQAGVASLGLPDVRITADEVRRHGFRAVKVRVECPPEKNHRHLHHIVDKIDASTLTEPQKELARRMFTRLGEAEAKVHGTTVRKVHFHEVGAADSIADLVGSAIAWDLLGPARIVCSPVPVGRGEIQIEHGRVGLPAPATAELLRSVPIAASDVRAELTTPTGAAIIATLVDEFGGIPAMSIESIGYGAGDRELTEQPNVLRIFVGEAAEHSLSDVVWVLETNLDDVSGEVIGHCFTRLGEGGALDVYATAIQMKKNRPGVKLTVLCGADRIAKLEQILFKETGTLGIRRWAASRHKLERRSLEVVTRFGPVAGKLAVHDDGGISYSPEFESCRAIAEQRRLAIRDVYRAAHEAFHAAPASHAERGEPTGGEDHGRTS